MATLTSFSVLDAKEMRLSPPATTLIGKTRLENYFIK